MTKRLEGRSEPILDPDLPILDSHMHLMNVPGHPYLLDDYLADAQAGHNVVGSIYCEAKTFARTDGPEHMRPLGEVEFANGVAAMCASGALGRCHVAAGIIGHADLTEGARIGELLDRCMQTAPDRFRAVRLATLDYPDERPFQFILSFKPRRGLLDHPALPEGFRALSERGLIFDAAIYDMSMPRLAEHADAHPDLTFVLGHIGNFVGVDMSPTERAEAFSRWQRDLRALAERPNVMCKIGGLGMPQSGFGLHENEAETTWEDMAGHWRPFVETGIEVFGVERCMMESNFPPDGRAGGFVPTWNAYKHLTRAFSEDERRDLFGRNAARIYRIDVTGL